MAAKSVVSANNLSWHVPSKKILQELCFTIEENEFVGIIGPNGAGKSSLLRCLYRKISPTYGDISLLDKPLSDYSSQSLAKLVAVVLQEPPSQFDLSVFEVISMGLTPHKGLLSFDSVDDRSRVEEAASAVGLEGFLCQSFNRLSGGEKQRVMIARAIVQQPMLLIMDEPTNHLDVKHQLEVLSIAKRLGITVIVSIHDLNLAAAYCDRLMLIDKGRILSAGASTEVLTEDNLSQVFGVDVKIDSHPFHKGPRITFDLRRAQ